MNKFIALIVLFVALISSTYAQFDDQELPALKSLRDKLPEQWIHTAFVEQSKVVLEAMVNRLDFKLQRYEEQLAPYMRAIEQKQSTLQQAMQRGSSQNVLQQLYDDLMKEQQTHAQQIQQIGSAGQATSTQKKWIEDLQFYTQGLESCELRRSLLVCRDESGLKLSQADLREERRSLNTILQWTSAEENPQLEDVTAMEALTNAEILEAARKLCQRRAEIVYRETEKVLHNHDELVRRAQEAQRQQQ